MNWNYLVELLPAETGSADRDPGRSRGISQVLPRLPGGRFLTPWGEIVMKSFADTSSASGEVVYFTET